MSGVQVLGFVLKTRQYCRAAPISLAVATAESLVAQKKLVASASYMRTASVYVSARVAAAAGPHGRPASAPEFRV